MVSSVRSGLSATLKRAAAEHSERDQGGKDDLEEVIKRVRDRQRGVVKGLPVFIRDGRLRAAKVEGGGPTPGEVRNRERGSGARNERAANTHPATRTVCGVAGTLSHS